LIEKKKANSESFPDRIEGEKKTERSLGQLYGPEEKVPKVTPRKARPHQQEQRIRREGKEKKTGVGNPGRPKERERCPTKMVHHNTKSNGQSPKVKRQRERGTEGKPKRKRGTWVFETP